MITIRDINGAYKTRRRISIKANFSFVHRQYGRQLKFFQKIWAFSSGASLNE